MKKMSFLAMGMALILGVGMLAGCGGGSGKAETKAAETEAAESAAAETEAAETGAAETEAAAPSGEQVTIKFVHKFPEAARMEYFESIVAQFEEENPDIDIVMTAYGDEEVKDKMRVLLGNPDDAPDVYFSWSGERLMNYVKTGNALDITSYLEEDSEWKDSFNQVMLEACNKNGSYWAVPWDYSSKEFIYNKAIFEECQVEVPTTYDEFLAACETIKNAGYTPIAIGNQYSWVICHYLTTLNGKMVPEDVVEANYTLEDPNFSDPGYAKALDMIKELYDKGYINSDANSATWEMSQSSVQEGKAAMIYEEVQDFVSYNDTMGAGNWGFFDFPEVADAVSGSGWITGGPDLFLVNSETQYPEQCIRFLKFLTSDEVQARMVYELGFLPSTGVELDAAQCLPETIEVINKNMAATGMSEWLDCVLDQTVSEVYLEGCQSIFMGDDGAAIMEKVSATAAEVKADME